MDKLQECAKSFEKLLDKKYNFVIGRKGKSAHIELAFGAVDFHHLMGLHKLKDLRLSRGNREKIFRDILTGNILLPNIEKSLYFDQIKNRIEPFSDLEKILDDNHIVFKYNEKAHSFSLIPAEYLLSTSYQANEIYIFIDRKGTEEQFFCRSFFPKEDKDYTIGQPAYTLLFKEKITISTGEKNVQYDRLSPVQKKTDLTTEMHSPSLTVTAPAAPVQQSMKKRMTAAQDEADQRRQKSAIDPPQPQAAAVDPGQPRVNMKNRLAMAQTEADQRNGSHDSQKIDHEKSCSKEEI